MVKVALASILMVSVVLEFRPPNHAERLKAVGSTEALPPQLRRALEERDDFEPMPTPKSGDWLAEHYEPGQTFDDFVNSGANKPDSKRDKIYLQPLGQFPKEPNDLIQRLRDYASSYFALEVRALPVLELDNVHITTRVNQYTQKRQLLAPDILKILRRRLPADAFCLLGITMEDLYPEPSWNFVFGQASYRQRVGVYSFARYDPLFYGRRRGPDYHKLLLRRSCKVLVHETGHMFGLSHCIYYRCVMNGSNHLQESDARPLHLCPVCLRKLQQSIGFDVISRYGRVLAFYNKVGFDEDARWVEKRLAWILGADVAEAK